MLDTVRAYISTIEATSKPFDEFYMDYTLKMQDASIEAESANFLLANHLDHHELSKFLLTLQSSIL